MERIPSPASPLPAFMNIKRVVSRLAVLAFTALCVATPALHAQTLSTTTLAITSNSNPVTSVTIGSAITLTATVTSNGAPQSGGFVAFCTVVALECNDIDLLGIAPLVSGTATLTLRPSIGTHSYAAEWGSKTISPSVSAIKQLVVTGTYPSTTAIVSSGSPGAYGLTGTVTSTGSLSSPSGTLSFLDTSNSNSLLGTATLSSTSPTLSFQTLSSSSSPFTGATGLGDLNNDGLPDLVAVNASGVVVGLGNGDGTFKTLTQQVTLAGVGAGSTAVKTIAFADFNADGKLDFAVESGGVVSVLLGNGDGTFSLAPATLAAGSNSSLAIGDFDQDGNLDIVAASQTANSLTIFLGNGNGTFSAPVTPPIVGLANPSAIAAADLNRDGLTDLVVTNSNSTSVLSLLNNTPSSTPRSITFSTTQVVAVMSPSTTTSSINLADLNNDDILDLIVPNDAAGTISVFLGDGTAKFGAIQTFPAGTSPQALLRGDFNNDGKVDFAAISSGSSTTGITLLTGNGDGTFATTAVPTNFVSSSPSNTVTSFASSDLNNDGGTDIVIAPAGSATTSNVLLSLFHTSTASLSNVSPVGAGTHNVDASFAGDSNFSASTSSNIPLTALQATTTITLQAPSTSAYGHQVTLTATLSPYTLQGQTTNGESVMFYNGTTSLGTGTLSSGSASINVSSFNAGTYSLSVKYGGDTNFLASTSTTSSFVVTPVAPTITIPAIPTHLSTDAPFTVQATSNSTAQITYSVSSSSPANVTASGNVATITLTGTGTVTLTASQVAAGNYTAGSATATFTVNPPPSYSFALSSPTVSIKAGSSGTDTVTVTPVGGFNQTITFSCSGLPSLAACSFSPATITPSGSPATSTLTITTTATTTSMLDRNTGRDVLFSRGRIEAAGLAILIGLLPLGARRRSWKSLGLFLFLGAIMILPLAGCGSKSGAATTTTIPGTPTGTTTVSVIATTGSGTSAATTTQTLTLTVN